MTIEQQLQERLNQLVEKIEQCEFYRTLSDGNGSLELTTHFFKHLYLSIYQYQPHVTEATFTAVGRLPKQPKMFVIQT